MTEMILTQHTGKFLGPIAKLLGYIMNLIYEFTCLIFPEGSALYGNIGLCIILFTIVIYLCLLPLTIKQQKFSKLSQKMQPELQAVQKKYKDRKDQESMMAMQQETKLVYEKYGVSPSGSCVQLIIQMPILFALYRVIYNVPAYVGGLKERFMPVVEGILGTNGYEDTMTEFVSNINLITTKLNLEESAVKNSIVDVLYAMPSSAWNTLKESFPDLVDVIGTLEEQLSRMNNFFGLNIADAPMAIIKSGWAEGQYLLVAGAVLIPVLSAVTQFLNTKLMPTSAAASDGKADSMSSTMKTMNYMMPMMSFIMVFSLPVGMGIYWIAGAVVRSVQQVVINHHIEKIDLEELIKKNQEKAKKKRAKKGIPENKISSAAKMNTRSRSIMEKAAALQQQQEEMKKEAAKKNQTYQSSVDYSKNSKPGSLAAKANMVKEFNERNNKK